MFLFDATAVLTISSSTLVELFNLIQRSIIKLIYSSSLLITITEDPTILNQLLVNQLIIGQQVFN
jgi:hypothetical protein